MSDQADGLRQLVQARTGAGASALAEPPSAARAAGPRARSLVLTSGKGGVGTSNLALNLAIALGEQGGRVVLVDADFGLANIDMLCGLAPSCDLGDVLAGDRKLPEAINRAEKEACYSELAVTEAAKSLADRRKDHLG